MNKKIEKQLIDEFPSYFRDMYGDPKKTCLAWGCDCGAGWYDIIHSLCDKVRKVEDKDTDFHFLQIKEKFGQLRAYCHYKTKQDEINNIIREAEDKSLKICETCASEENVTTEGRPWWISTLCKKCASEKTKKFTADAVTGSNF